MGAAKPPERTSANRHPGLDFYFAGASISSSRSGVASISLQVRIAHSAVVVQGDCDELVAAL